MMMAGSSQGEQVSGEVTLWLLLAAGEPLRGVLRVGEESRVTEFCGWLELMAAIDAAREPRGGRQAH